MNILIIGGAGNIGRAICRFLIADSHSVMSLSRTVPTEMTNGVAYCQVDRNDTNSIVKLIRDHKIDTVIDMIALAHPSTSQLLEGIASLIDRYVLISSCDVYRNYGILRRTETGEPDMETVAESADLRGNWYPFRLEKPRPEDDPDKWMDDYDKIPIELSVKTLSCNWTILRLPMVYGPGDPQRRFSWLLEPIFRNDPNIVVPTAWLDWKTSYGYIDNVGSLVSSAATHNRTSKEVYNVSDEEPVSHRIWVDRFRTAAGWTGAIEETDNTDIDGYHWLTSLDLTVPLLINGASLWKTLNYTHNTDLATRIATTIDDERRQFDIKQRH